MARAIALMVIGVAAFGTVASAVQITHSTQGTLFSDGFETGTVGGTPTGGTPGSWSIFENGGTARVSDAVDPGAYMGSKYLAVVNHKAGAHATFADVTDGTLSATFAYRLAQTSYDGGNTSGAIGFTDMGRLDSAFHMSHTWLTFLDPADTLVADMGGTTTGASAHDALLFCYTPSGWQQVKTGGSNMIMPYDTWVDMTLTLDVATDTWTVAMNGVTSDTLIGSGQQDSSVVRGLSFQTNGIADTTFYVDAVPEPATLSLLALAGLAVLRRRG